MNNLIIIIIVIIILLMFIDKKYRRDKKKLKEVSKNIQVDSFTNNQTLDRILNEKNTFNPPMILNQNYSEAEFMSIIYEIEKTLDSTTIHMKYLSNIDDIYRIGSKMSDSDISDIIISNEISLAHANEKIREYSKKILYSMYSCTNNVSTLYNYIKIFDAPYDTLTANPLELREIKPYSNKRYDKIVKKYILNTIKSRDILATYLACKLYINISEQKVSSNFDIIVPEIDISKFKNMTITLNTIKIILSIIKAIEKNYPNDKDIQNEIYITLSGYIEKIDFMNNTDIKKYIVVNRLKYDKK